MSAVGQANPFSDASEYNALDFIIARATEKMQTVSVGQVIAVNTGAQTVDVQILVNLVTGANTPVEHEVIANRPYYRMQGGGNAIICDPVVGDIGVVVFASRDITGVVAAKGAANPSSNRKFSWSDGIYLGGVLNGTPTQYMQFLAAGGGINIVSPGTVAVMAPAFTASGTATITGNTTLQATLAVTGTSTLTGLVTASAGLTAGGPITGTSAVFSGNVTAASFTGGGGGGSGTVTSVATGTGLTGGPITTSGTISLSGTTIAALALATTALQSISIATGTGLTGGPLGASGSTVALANTAVTPGSYTSANITVDAQGRLTAASNGSGGSSGPGGVSTGLYFWFEGDQLSGSGGSGIAQLTNATPGIGALIAANATTTGATVGAAGLNSLNVAVFPGTSTGRYTIPQLSPQLVLSTSFIVFKVTSASAVYCFYSGVVGSLQYGTDGSGHVEIVKTQTAAIASSTTAIAAATWYQANVTYNSSTGAYAFRQARAAAGSGTSSQPITGQSNAIAYQAPASTQDLAGSIAELIIYNRVLSSAEITAVESYLNTKWGV